MGDPLVWNRGNKLFLTQDLRDVVNGTAKLAGDNEATCLRITDKGFDSRWMCSVTVYLTDHDKDTVTVVGPFQATAKTYASIVGGTGIYSGASGSAEMSPAGPLPDGSFAYFNIFRFD